MCPEMPLLQGEAVKCPFCVIYVVFGKFLAANAVGCNHVPCKGDAVRILNVGEFVVENIRFMPEMALVEVMLKENPK